MHTKIYTLALLLTSSFLLLLTGCIGFGNPFDSEDQQQIDQQIREAIEKTFPLPEQVLIKTHIGDDLRFSTELSVDEVVEFYRDAYSQKSYEEGESQIQADGAALLFKKVGEKDVALDVIANASGCEVHLLLRSATP